MPIMKSEESCAEVECTALRDTKLHIRSMIHNSVKYHKLWYCAILSEAGAHIARSTVTDMKVPSQVTAVRRADSWAKDLAMLEELGKSLWKVIRTQTALIWPSFPPQDSCKEVGQNRCPCFSRSL